MESHHDLQIALDWAQNHLACICTAGGSSPWRCFAVSSKLNGKWSCIEHLAVGQILRLVPPKNNPCRVAVILYLGYSETSFAALIHANRLGSSTCCCWIDVCWDLLYQIWFFSCALGKYPQPWDFWVSLEQPNRTEIITSSSPSLSKKIDIRASENLGVLIFLWVDFVLPSRSCEKAVFAATSRCRDAGFHLSRKSSGTPQLGKFIGQQSWTFEDLQ